MESVSVVIIWLPLVENSKVGKWLCGKCPGEGRKEREVWLAEPVRVEQFRLHYVTWVCLHRDQFCGVLLILYSCVSSRVSLVVWHFSGNLIKQEHYARGHLYNGWDILGNNKEKATTSQYDFMNWNENSWDRLPPPLPTSVGVLYPSILQANDIIGKAFPDFYGK